MDAAGNQLPYIDRIEYRYVPDAEVLSIQHMAGEVDYTSQGIGLVKVALFKENEETGNYKVHFGRYHVVGAAPVLNLTYVDETWRSVVQDIRFRRALSLAMDRQEIIDAIWYGFAELPTVQDATYDPEAAEALLDEMGLDQRDADGFRLGPDGKTFTILFETNDQIYADFINAAELYAQFWSAVGVKTTREDHRFATLGPAPGGP